MCATPSSGPPIVLSSSNAPNKIRFQCSRLIMTGADVHEQRATTKHGCFKDTQPLKSQAYDANTHLSQGRSGNTNEKLLPERSKRAYPIVCNGERINLHASKDTLDMKPSRYSGATCSAHDVLSQNSQPAGSHSGHQNRQAAQELPKRGGRTGGGRPHR